MKSNLSARANALAIFLGVLVQRCPLVTVTFIMSTLKTFKGAIKEQIPSNE